MNIGTVGSMLSPQERRFLAMVDKGEGCWLYHGPLSRKGYGLFTVDGRVVKAHRYAYAIEHGTLPDGLYPVHVCPGGANPACCRADHMAPSTNKKIMVAPVAATTPRAHEPAPIEDHAPIAAPPVRKASPPKQEYIRKLTQAQVDTIRLSYQPPTVPYVPGPRVTQDMLAEAFGISHSHINRIVLGHVWRESYTRAK